jgi:hypothetical protein
MPHTQKDRPDGGDRCGRWKTVIGRDPVRSARRAAALRLSVGIAGVAGPGVVDRQFFANHAYQFCDESQRIRCLRSTIV